MGLKLSLALTLALFTILFDDIMTTATPQQTTHLVLVKEVALKNGKFGEYKRIYVVEEQGQWLQTFYFNLFSTHDLYEAITVDAKLRVKVYIFCWQQTFIVDNNFLLLTTTFYC